MVNEKGIKKLGLVIVGGVPIASQEEYYERLKKMVKELELEGYEKFVDSVPYSEVLNYYQKCDVFVSTSQTGSIDKVALEAMACEKPSIVCNETFKDIFRDYSKTLMFRRKDPADLADKIIYIMQMDKNSRDKMCRYMRETVEREHNVDSLIDKLICLWRDIYGVKHGFY